MKPVDWASFGQRRVIAAADTERIAGAVLARLRRALAG